jgi:hypothetical protein
MDAGLHGRVPLQARSSEKTGEEVPAPPASIDKPRRPCRDITELLRNISNHYSIYFFGKLTTDRLEKACATGIGMTLRRGPG